MVHSFLFADAFYKTFKVFYFLSALGSFFFVQNFLLLKIFFTFTNLKAD